MNVKKIIKAYLILYLIVLFLYDFTNSIMAWGEPDDYVLPIASILNDHNFSINESDVEYCYKLFPELRDTISNCYSLSGYMSRDGKGELTWYYPTYAIINIPFVMILKLMGIKTIYSFPLTNIALTMILLCVINKYLQADDYKKLIAILVFSINPVILYFPWTSAEAMIYAFLAMAMVFWYNNWHKRAALFLAIAGTLNPTVLAIGFLLIAEYFIVQIKNVSELVGVTEKVRCIISKMFSFGLCFIPGIIPMIYFFYNTGYINLTASYSSFTNGNSTGCMQR